MKISFTFIFIFMLLHLALFSQALQNTENFENIRINSKSILNNKKKSGKIYLLSDTVNRIEINQAGKEMGISGLPFKIEQGVLTLSTPLDIANEAEVIIHVKTLRSLSVRGAVDIISKNAIKTDELKLDVSGSNEITLEVISEKLSVNTAGAGDVTLKGKVGDLSIDASGASDISAFNLEAMRCKISSSGASDIEVNVSESLQGDIHGAGNITYSGEPSKVNVDVSGAGNLEKKNQGSSTSDSKEKKEDEKEVMIQLGKKKFAFKDLDDEEEDKDSNKKKDAELKSMWSGFEFGINGYTTSSRSIGMPGEHPYYKLNYGRSFVFNFNFWEENISIVGPYMGLLTGLGMEFNRYQFAERYRLQNIPDTLTGIFTGDRYRTNLLKMTYFTLPLMLQFQTNSNPEKASAIALGVIGAWRPWTAKLRQTAYIDEVYRSSTTHGNYYVNPFKLMLATRIAIKNVEIFSSYSLTPLFAKGKTIDLFPFTLGLRLIPF